MMSAPDFSFKQVIIIFLRDGESMSFKNDNIIVKDKDKKIKHQSSCYRLFSVFLVGHCTITSGLLERSKRFGFSIVMFNYNMKVYGYWNTGTEGNTLLRKKQYRYDGLEIAQKIVKNKIENQCRALRKIRNKEDYTKQAITKLQEFASRLPNLQYNSSKILGVEGNAAKVYFKAMFDCCSWQARRPRAKMDTVNTLLDIGYTVLFNFIESLLELYGFDIYQGVYHKLFYQRKSLVCDMVEVFRPIIDYAIRKMYKLQQVNEDDFICRNNKYYLMGEKSQKYMQVFLEVIVANKDDIFKYIQSYYRAFIQEKQIADYPVYEVASC